MVIIFVVLTGAAVGLIRLVRLIRSPVLALHEPIYRKTILIIILNAALMNQSTGRPFSLYSQYSTPWTNLQEDHFHYILNTALHEPIYRKIILIIFSIRSSYYHLGDMLYSTKLYYFVYVAPHKLLMKLCLQNIWLSFIVSLLLSFLVQLADIWLYSQQMIYLHLWFGLMDYFTSAIHTNYIEQWIFIYI